jgi:lipoprotein-releasing system permease protein
MSIMNGYIYRLLEISLEVKSYHVLSFFYHSEERARRDEASISNDGRLKISGIYREGKVLASANGRTTGLVSCRAYDEDMFYSDTNFNKIVKLLKGERELRGNGIMISEKTAQKLRVNVGDNIFLTSMSESNDKDIRLRIFKVSGIFTTGFVDFDEYFGLIGMNASKNLFFDDTTYTIFLKLNDYREAKDFVNEYSFKGMLNLYDWERYNYNDIVALRFEKNVIAFIVLLVVFVATLNLLTTTYINTEEKRRAIGILKAIGISNQSIVVIFLLNGLYLAIIGIAIGVILGLFISGSINIIINFLNTLLNSYTIFISKLISIFTNRVDIQIFEIMSKDIYFEKIYTELSIYELIFVSFITLLFSIIASIIPAIKAGRMKPNEVIKNG